MNQLNPGDHSRNCIETGLKNKQYSIGKALFGVQAKNNSRRKKELSMII